MSKSARVKTENGWVDVREDAGCASQTFWGYLPSMALRSELDEVDDVAAWRPVELADGGAGAGRQLWDSIWRGRRS